MKSTLHPQNFGYTPKNEGKRVHVPPDEKTCGHTLSHIPLYYTMFNSYRHLGLFPDLPDTIVKGDHPRTIVAKFDSNLLGGCREEDL